MYDHYIPMIVAHSWLSTTIGYISQRSATRDADVSGRIDEGLSAGAASMKERTDQTEALLEQGVEKVDVVWNCCIPWYIDVYIVCLDLWHC